MCSDSIPAAIAGCIVPSSTFRASEPTVAPLVESPIHGLFVAESDELPPECLDLAEVIALAEAA